ncbi:trehalose-phosphatase [Lentzea sp. JNUCC 0626]|uniref:trehalose-phosphatase n=1 Tax=Lentzea sp. JNUCC 0626 TaxID=3367513 RepID=UPI00374817BE
MPGLPAALLDALVPLARTPHLLVACDYDGTLAPLAARPDEAVPDPSAVAVLRRIALLPDTTTAVISGRALRDLALLSRLPTEVRLVGSHGSEFDAGFVHELGPAERRLLADLRRVLTDGVARYSSPAVIEVRPASVAVHHSRCRPDEARWLLAQLRTGPGSWEGVRVTEGRSVIEFSVVPADKGQALDVLRHQAGATAAAFLGDDAADEKAFAQLSGKDVGIRVGDGDTVAAHRIEDIAMVVATFTALLEHRTAWLSSGFARTAPAE